MKRYVAAACLALVSTSASAQINPQAITMSGVNACVKEAMAASPEQNGNALLFSCSANTAKVLFNLIGRKIQTEVVQDRNGKFENRQFGNSACYRRVEDPNGKAADDYRCDLVMVIGDALVD